MPAFRHLTSTKQMDRSWIESEILPLCEDFRRGKGLNQTLNGHALYCLFYEPSFLTRTSFERAVGLLGGVAYHTEDASQFYPVRTPSHIDNIIHFLASLHMDVVVLRSSDEGVVDRAAATDAVPVINGGSLDDHPTQALADICTLQRELGAVDGINIAVVGRLEHRNVSALLTGLALYNNVTATLLPFSGQVDPNVASYCESRGMKLVSTTDVDAVGQADAIYLNAPKTVAHAQILRSRSPLNLRINKEFMSGLRPHCIIMDPMQRSGDFTVEAQDPRLALYRQSENALFVRMAVLAQLLSR